MALAMFATPALAQSGSDGYNAIQPEVIQKDDGNGVKDTPPQSSERCEPGTSGNGTAGNGSSGGDACKTTTVAAGNELPFTGLDVGLVAAAGAALLGAGAGMRRLTRAPDAA